MTLKFPAFLYLCGLIFLFAAICPAQKIAVLTPEKTVQSEKFAGALENALSEKLKILDSSMSEAAFLSTGAKTPFNLTTGEARIIGEAIGCDYFVLLRAADQRRFSLYKSEYVESYAAVYLVSSRTGRLVFWKLPKTEGKTAVEAENELLALNKALADEIFEQLPIISKAELNENPSQKFAEIPETDAPEAKNFRPPLPYRRISPPYTELARLYSVEATVDIEVEVDETGQIQRTEIVRWAGFGLDQSVTQTVRAMNWRPAERNGKTLPIRALLRYNFKKIDEEE